MAETKYKQTEIGLIPEEWERKPLKEVSKMQRGTSITRNSVARGDIPVIAGGQSPAYYCNVSNREGETVTISGSGEYAGYVAYWEKPIFVSDAFSVKGTENCTTKYLYYILKGMQRKIYATKKGAGVPHVIISSIDDFLIPLPPLTEQHAIASALTSVDNLIVSLDKQIAKTQSVKQGAMQQLFMMLNSEDVKYECFHDVCLFVRGVTYNKEQEISIKGDGYSILRANNITLGTNTLNFEDVKVVCRDVRIKEEQFLHKNDILMCAGSGSKEHVGKVAYIDKDIDYAFGGFMAVIRTKTNLNSKFLFYILSSNSFKDYLDQAISCCTINNINSSMMRDFLIPIPSMETQHRIASALTAIDNQISALEAKRKKYEMVKVGMMQQLLTGKIRLK